MTVTITTATSGATIYYTTNGTTPTTSSPVYTGPFTLGKGVWTVRALAVKSGSVDSSVGSKVYRVNDFLSSTTWQEVGVGNWTGTFTWRFQATPNAANMDGVATLATSGNIDAFADNAVLIRFNDTGNIDARNGATYSALVTYPYVAGTTYEFTVVVNVAAKTYTVDVKPVGGTVTRIATDWTFRTEQNGITDIDYMGWFSEPGSFRIQNVTIQAGTGTASPPSPPTGLRIDPIRQRSP